MAKLKVKKQQQDIQQMRETDEAITQLYIARNNIDVQITKLAEERDAARGSMVRHLKEQGWTQQNIASYLGMTQPTISRWLQAKCGGGGSEQSIVD